jgi:tellurite methyltransferase
MFETDLAGGTWPGGEPVKVIGAISASHAGPDSKTSRPGVGVSLSAAMSTKWTRYYEAAGEQPRETLLFALERFDADAGARGRGLFAVDLGCGTGRDTVELLRRGWRVLAIDAEAEAIQRLLGRGDLDSGGAGRLATQVARFENAGWPEADLINSSYALPFCPANQFGAVWQRIVASLRAGGRFSGHLFGDRDGWATEPDMSFQTLEDAEELLRGLEVEHFEEVEEDGQTAVGDPKHWHLFQVVARKRTR